MITTAHPIHHMGVVLSVSVVNARRIGERCVFVMVLSSGVGGSEVGHSCNCVSTHLAKICAESFRVNPVHGAG